MSFIKDPAERAARAAAKRHALLRFLRDEVFTTPAVAGLVMGVEERAARQTVASMEKQGLVRRHVIKVVDTLPPLTIVGITSHGQGMAFDVEAGEEVSGRVFEPAKFSLVYLNHTLDIQRLRIQAVNSGRVSKWLPGDSLGAVLKGVKRPDAVLLTAEKIRVAVEVERHVKNVKRYTGILSAHLTAIKQGKWNRVVWACPDQKVAARVAAIVKSIKRVPVVGIDTQITDAHRQALTFTTYEQFVHNL